MMKNASVAMAGLLCFVAGAARAQTFEEQLLKVSAKTLAQDKSGFERGVPGVSGRELIDTGGIDDSWELTSLDKGTVITIKADLRIPAYAKKVNIRTGEVDANPFMAQNGVQCHLQAESHEYSDEVIKIPAGRKFELKSVDPFSYRGLKSQTLEFSASMRDKIDGIVCESLERMPVVSDLRRFVDVAPPAAGDNVMGCVSKVRGMQYAWEPVISLQSAVDICGAYSGEELQFAKDIRSGVYPGSESRMGVSEALAYARSITRGEFNCAQEIRGATILTEKRMTIPEAVEFCRKNLLSK